MKTLPILFTAFVGTSSFAAAQHADVFIMDKTQYQLLRISDIDADGLYYSLNEASSFAASKSVEGAEMRFESGLPVAYWVDDSDDIIYRGVDLDWNGLLEGAEITAFRNSKTIDGSSNADGIALTPDGAVWWSARYDNGSSTMRGVHRMKDLTGNNDANDAGELVTVVPDNGTVFAPSAVTGGLVPVDTENFTRITRSGNGVVAYTGFSGNFSNDFCLYRFEDINGDGDVNDAGESINFINAVTKNPSLDRNADFQSGLLRDLATVDGGGVPTGHARLMYLATLNEGGKDIIYAASD